MGILDDVKRYPDLSHIWLDREKLMKSIGFDLTNREYIVLAQLGISEVPELVMKSLMWLETINETLSTAKKMYLDQKLESERVYARAIKNIMAMEDGYKVTEAKAHAKVSVEYIDASKKLNTLDAYVEYLERLIDNLNKYHYTIKSRMDRMDSVERKY